MTHERKQPEGFDFVLQQLIDLHEERKLPEFKTILSQLMKEKERSEILKQHNESHAKLEKERRDFQERLENERREFQELIRQERLEAQQERREAQKERKEERREALEQQERQQIFFR